MFDRSGALLCFGRGSSAWVDCQSCDRRLWDRRDPPLLRSDTRLGIASGWLVRPRVLRAFWPGRLVTPSPPRPRGRRAREVAPVCSAQRRRARLRESDGGSAAGAREGARSRRHRAAAVQAPFQQRAPRALARESDPCRAARSKQASIARCVCAQGRKCVAQGRVRVIECRNVVSVPSGGAC